jgi:hypothetical protein
MHCPSTRREIMRNAITSQSQRAPAAQKSSAMHGTPQDGNRISKYLDQPLHFFFTLEQKSSPSTVGHDAWEGSVFCIVGLPFDQTRIGINMLSLVNQHIRDGLQWRDRGHRDRLELQSTALRVWLSRALPSQDTQIKTLGHGHVRTLYFEDASCRLASGLVPHLAGRESNDQSDMRYATRSPSVQHRTITENLGCEC